MRGSVIKRGRTWSYVVDIGRDPTTGRRRQKWKGGFATRGKAEDALARVISGVDRVHAPSALTLGGFLDQWLAGCAAALKPSTVKSYREVIRWYVQPRLGDVKLTDANALMVRNLYAELLASGSVRHTGAPLAPATVGVVHRVLRKTESREVVGIECDARCVQPASAGWSLSVSRGLSSCAIEVSER